MSAISLQRIGVVVHPSRDVSGPLAELRTWAQRYAVVLGQIVVHKSDHRVAPECLPADCDLVLAVGGDGTMLAAIRAAMPTRHPVLGIACGSLGVLARVPVGEVGPALDRVAAGDWSEEPLPGIATTRPGADETIALNDLSVVRAGIGQIRVTVRVDDVLSARIAGLGAVVATALGSSAYSLAAGGPLLGPGAAGMVITPLATHGGAVPPLVVGPDARVDLEVDGGFGGARLELDGQVVSGAPRRIELALRLGVARLVALPGQPPALGVLRDRGIVADSPRIVADDRRSGRNASDAGS